MRSFFKKRIYAVIALGASLFLSSLIHAADLEALNRLFLQHYRGSFYQQNRCGTNTETFVRVALREQVNLDGAYLIQLENKGGSNFGLVGALFAREQGRLISANPPKGMPEREPGTANWEYHAFIVADGYVFDFDFDNNPRVVPFLDYLREMFIPASKHNDATYIREKLAGYHLRFFPIKPNPADKSYQLQRHELFDAPRDTYLLPYLDSLKRP